MSNRTKVLLGLLVIFLISGFFFPVPTPHVSLVAEQIFSIFGFPITNTVITTWVVMALLIVASWLATRNLQLVPTGLQNVFEFLLEWMLGLVENVAGPVHGRKFFPLVATIFIMILISNWIGLFPGLETIGIVKAAEGSEHAQTYPTTQIGPITIATIPFGGLEENAEHSQAEAGGIQGEMLPLLRAPNTDLNTTLGLALVAMIMVQVWGFQSLGFRGYGSKFFTLRGGAVGAFVGIMELVSEFAKIISLTFRLFGNIFAGHVLLAVIGFLVPWVAVLPFFGLELFVGLIQALIFAVLTLAFATVAVSSHAEHEGERAEESLTH